MGTVSTILDALQIVPVILLPPIESTALRRKPEARVKNLYKQRLRLRDILKREYINHRNLSTPVTTLTTESFRRV